MKFSIVDNFSIILKRRKFIIKFVFAIAIITLVISLFVPNQYKAVATVMPPNPERDAMMGLIFSSIPSGIAGITSAGGLLGGPTTSDLYANIMKSRVILDKIVEQYQLKKVFKTRTMDDTYKALLSITEIIVTPEGIISVSVTYRNKTLAANIANAYVEELDRFNTETAMTVGKKYRIFIEQRLKETIASMANAEDALKAFQEKHKTVALTEEIQSAIETIAQLKSEIIMKEVQKGAMASSSSGQNPYVISIDQELAQLRKQLSKIEFGGSDSKDEFGAGFSMPFSELPALSMEYARLLREVKVQEAIYELMTQQYEQAKIMELKDTPTVQFLDRAVPPEKKSSPKRGILLITAVFLSTIIGVCSAFVFERVENLRVHNPEEYAKWSKVLAVIKKDLTRLMQYFLKMINWLGFKKKR